MSKKAVSRFSKTHLIIAGAVVLLLLAYVFIVPGILAGSYKDKALPAQNEIAEKMTVLGEQYKRPAFTKVDTTPAAAKADFEATRKTLTEARERFNQQKGNLTGFVNWPGMGLHGNYRDAKTASQDAKEWVGKTEQLLAAADADLSYFEKRNALDAKFENIGTSLDSLTGEESLEVFAQKNDQFAAELQAAAAEYRQLQPTESLKKSHDAELVLADKFVSQLKEFSAALRAGDIGKEEAVSAQLDATGTEMNNQTNQSVIDYAREATVNKLIAELQVLDRKLDDDFKRF